MQQPLVEMNRNWCIVVADDATSHEPGRTWQQLERAPVQYRALEGAGSLLDRALLRAAALSSDAHVLLALGEECRALWERSLHGLETGGRFVSACRLVPQLACAAAVLHVARQDPRAIITILPARAYVAQEWALRRALLRARGLLAETSEGVITLGMIDMDDPLDEDYLVVTRPGSEASLPVRSLMRRPLPVAAEQLRRRGAVVASGILVGYAQCLAAPLLKYWPQIMRSLHEQTRRPATEWTLRVGRDTDLPWRICRSHLRHPALVPQRVLPVCGSGWSSLRSPRAVERVLRFVSASAGVRPREPSGGRTGTERTDRMASGWAYAPARSGSTRGRACHARDSSSPACVHALARAACIDPAWCPVVWGPQSRAAGPDQPRAVGLGRGPPPVMPAVRSMKRSSQDRRRTVAAPPRGPGSWLVWVVLVVGSIAALCCVDAYLGLG